MGREHFAAAAFSLMAMGFFVLRASRARKAGWAKVITHVIPAVYLGALYLVFILA